MKKKYYLEIDKQDAEQLISKLSDDDFIEITQWIIGRSQHRERFMQKLIKKIKPLLQ